MRTDNAKKKMWLVLPYYHNGDLQQFLKHNTIDINGLIRISHSICLAVDFIHSEKDGFGCQRLALAHRDIKVSFSILLQRESEILRPLVNVPFFVAKSVDIPVLLYGYTENIV